MARITRINQKPILFFSYPCHPCHPWFDFFPPQSMAEEAAALKEIVEEQSRQAGLGEVFCLTTQAANYFVQKGGFRLATPDDLPEPRRVLYDASGRRSQVLVKAL